MSRELDDFLIADWGLRIADCGFNSGKEGN
jgi:hypothetical protein